MKVETRTVRIVGNRAVRSYSKNREPKVSKKNAKYFYKIYPEDTIPEKKWCTTHSPLFERIFRESPEWTETNDLRRVHYTDYSVRSPIKSFFRTKEDITTKIFLANLLQKNTARPEYYQPTIVIRNGRLDFLNEENKKLYEDNAHVKWFLKPSRGYGGTGITIVDSPQKAKTYFKRPAAGFPETTLERDPKKAKNLRADYVLQKGVTDVLLYQGYKFDIRIWLLFVFGSEFGTNSGNRGAEFGTNSGFKIYLYNDAFLRVSTQPYRESSTNPIINITNLTYQGNQRSRISKTYTFKSQEFYQETFPKIKTACSDLVDRLQKHLLPSPKGFEIMGLDFLLDRQRDPYLLEINRFIGYPANARNKSVVDLVYKMLRDTIDIGIKARIDSAFEIGDDNGWMILQNPSLFRQEPPGILQEV